MTNICMNELNIMFFCDSLKFLQLRVRCIRSWSRPVVAITMNTPAMNCFQK